MKFEKPNMYISRFDVENIVTGSTNLDTAGKQADAMLEEMQNEGKQAVKISVQFTL